MSELWWWQKEGLNANGIEDSSKAVKTPLETQIGGDHYKNQGLQPFEITFANFGYFGLRAAVYTKVNKYLKRDKETHREDIEKAIHCLQIQLQFLDQHEQESITQEK